MNILKKEVQLPEPERPRFCEGLRQVQHSSVATRQKTLRDLGKVWSVLNPVSPSDEQGLWRLCDVRLCLQAAQCLWTSSPKTTHFSGVVRQNPNSIGSSEQRDGWCQNNFHKAQGIFIFDFESPHCCLCLEEIRAMRQATDWQKLSCCFGPTQICAGGSKKIQHI